MSVTAIILAAGKGTRMNSPLPKVLHPVCGRAMLAWVIDACRQAGCGHIINVIGHGAQQVRDEFAAQKDLSWVEQTQQLGTGHAVMMCRGELAALSGPVLVVGGDGPLIRPATLAKLIDTHTRQKAACTLATCILDEPARYGRIVRDARGELAGIVEYLDATDAQRAVNEVNVSLYCFDAAALRDVLPRLTNNNQKNEYYLTDTLALLRSGGQKLAAAAAVPPQEVLSINTPQELSQVERILSERFAQEGAKL